MKTTKNILTALLILIACVVSTIQIANAQAFEKGDNLLGVGVGIGGSYNSYSTYSSQTPALSLFYEHMSHLEVGPGALSFGAYLGYKSLTYTDEYLNHFNRDFKWTYTILGFRSAYHYDLFKSKNWDPYGGAMLSYNIVSYTDNTNYNGYQGYDYHYPSYVALTLFVGARYYFSPKFGAFAELGYGIAYLNLGVQFKL